MFLTSAPRNRTKKQAVGGWGGAWRQAGIRPPRRRRTSEWNKQGCRGRKAVWRVARGGAARDVKWMRAGST